MHHGDRTGGPARDLYAGHGVILATSPQSGDVYLYNGSPNNWSLIGGPGRQFATTNDGLYGLTPNGDAVNEWAGAVCDCARWRNFGGPAGRLFAGGGSVLATNPQTGDVYRRGVYETGWRKIGGPGADFQIADRSDPEVFGLTPNRDAVYLWTGGQSWTRIGGPAAVIAAT